jgi:hypothetical protein
MKLAYLSLWTSLGRVAGVATQCQGADMPTRYRDAVTGEYVTEDEAKKRPRETVKETDKKSPPRPKGKK